MDLELKASSPVPLYMQLVEQVHRLVALGALRAGDRLPTIRDLAVKARVNRNTAARAIRHLEQEGLVRTRVGQGTFVNESGSPGVDPARRERTMEELLDSLLVEAHTLGVPLEELGWRLSRRIEVFVSRRRESAGEMEEQR